MRIRKLSRLLAVITIICFVFSQPVFAGDSTSGSTADMDYLKSIMDMIKEKYNGDVTEQQLIEGAVKGMFDTMDPYTTYFTSDQAKSFFDQVGGTFEGIGIAMTKVGDYVVVAKVFPASPADKAGLAIGDKLVSVDGKSVVGSSLDEVASLVLGESGTKVTLGIIKKGDKDIISVEITRAKIKINPVTYEIKNDIGYIRLEMFNSNADEYISQALEEMDNKGIEKVVLDLRDNPGGEVDQAVAIAKNFVPKGLITKLSFKSSNIKPEEYYSNLKSVKYKLVVLVNGMSASASEILAGAIQDTGAGTLVGTKTFGKAKVQTVVPLLTPEAYEKYRKQLGVEVIDAYELINKYQIMPLKNEVIGWSKITTGEYTTPNGRMIDKQGLTPDVFVDDPVLDKDINIYSIQKLQKIDKPGLSSEGIDVYNAEKILKLAGFDVDTPDMKLDQKTSAALAKFQLEKGGYPCGVLDFTTQQWLNDKLDQLMLQIDTQYEKAVEILNK